MGSLVFVIIKKREVQIREYCSMSLNLGLEFLNIYSMYHIAEWSEPYKWQWPNIWQISGCRGPESPPPSGVRSWNGYQWPISMGKEVFFIRKSNFWCAFAFEIVLFMYNSMLMNYEKFASILCKSHVFGMKQCLYLILSTFSIFTNFKSFAPIYWNINWTIPPGTLYQFWWNFALIVPKQMLLF